MTEGRTGSNAAGTEHLTPRWLRRSSAWAWQLGLLLLLLIATYWMVTHFLVVTLPLMIVAVLSTLTMPPRDALVRRHEAQPGRHHRRARFDHPPGARSRGSGAELRQPARGPGPEDGGRLRVGARLGRGGADRLRPCRADGLWQEPGRLAELGQHRRGQWRGQGRLDRLRVPRRFGVAGRGLVLRHQRRRRPHELGRGATPGELPADGRSAGGAPGPRCRATCGAPPPSR